MSEEVNVTSLHQKSYGAWAGDPQGQKPEPKLCCKSVIHYNGRWPHHRQCQRKRGYGPEGAYCRQHAPETIKAARDEWEANYRKRRAVEDRKWIIRNAGERMLAALWKIAAGDNDPRTTATKALEGLPPPPDQGDGK